MGNVIEQMMTLSNDLGFDFNEFYLQDWGIVYADSKRVNEFIHYYRQNLASLSQLQIHKLQELVLASADKSLLDTGTLSDITVEQFIKFIRENRDNFQRQLDYWTQLEEIEFPIVKILAKI
jgi:beta-glucosidase/6-phospho-beta-glucosidase/beta-galactosidase